MPPATLRGALAAVMKQHETDATTMNALFGETGCRTSALCPIAPHAPTEASVVPVPLTVRSCKFKPGFRADGQHGVEDVLVAALHFALHDDGGGLSDARQCRHPECTHVLKAMSNFTRYNPEANTWHKQGASDTRMQAHVGLDRRRRGAASGILYAREVLSEQTTTNHGDSPALHPTTMQAHVAIPEAHATTLSDALTPGTILRIGGDRSRGLGRCTVEHFDTVSARMPAIRDRIEDFNAAWKASFEGTNHQPKDGVLVVLTLETPALFVDAMLRPNLAPDGADLLQAAQPSASEAAEALEALAPVHQIARPVSVHGWNGLARFPHASAQGLQAGSVLVFRAHNIDEPLLRALEHIETHGIGLQRHLGYGRTRVCLPLHTDVHEHTARSATAR